MAAPPQRFILDRDIFNQGLYSRIQSLWFKDVPENATAADFPVLKRWFGIGSEEDKAAFDAHCHACSIEALDSIGPEKLALPPFKSHEDEKQNAAVLSGPFLTEVEQAQSRGTKEAADTLLALILLLDQMPRNIFRKQDDLPRVYNHYDRLSLSLLESARALKPSPLDYPPYAHRPVLKTWYFMPLLHSESLPAHDLWAKYHHHMREHATSREDNEALKILAAGLQAEEQHLEPLKQFGRFPHRNECLERDSTSEETEYLKTANTFGVKQGGAKPSTGKDEL